MKKTYCYVCYFHFRSRNLIVVIETIFFVVVTWAELGRDEVECKGCFFVEEEGRAGRRG
jgi:hypothetical protein